MTLPPSSYQIADEKTSLNHAPWNPSALFYLTWLCFVFAGLLVPLPFLFSVWNWRLLGKPQEFKKWLLFVFLVAALPFVMGILVHLTGQPSPEIMRIVFGGAVFALAYAFLLQQRPIFSAMKERGVKTSSTLALWAICLVLGAFIIRTRA
jgi:hypothetical protein